MKEEYFLDNRNYNCNCYNNYVSGSKESLTNTNM